ncbi:MAG: hypothetical protein K2G65_02885 [Eubacterium sp.]|nr:hypothetical protein [Eubacterium sp.]
MKKFLAVITAICVMLTASITAFAQAQPKSEDVRKEIDKIVNYITSQKEGDYTIDDAVDFYYLTNSGADLSKYNDKFIASVKENIKANNGKLITQYGESLATYAAVIEILMFNDIDVWEFEGYDLTAAFAAMPADSEMNPYYYNIVIPALFYIEDEAFCEAVCKNFVDKYYTMGKGMENWGYSCDNTAYFISAISYASDEYTAQLNDALKVIETYKTDGGYFCDNQYTTTLNANSTGLALMAYAEYEWLDSLLDDNAETINLNKSTEIYNQLSAFKTSTDGAYSFEVGGEPNLFATFDILRGLTSYVNVLMIKELIDEPIDWDDIEDPEVSEKNPTKKPESTTKFQVKPLVTQKNDTAATTSTETKKNTSKKSPSTGAGAMTIALSIALAGAGTAVLAAKKKEQ